MFHAFHEERARCSGEAWMFNWALAAVVLVVVEVVLPIESDFGMEEGDSSSCRSSNGLDM